MTEHFDDEFNGGDAEPHSRPSNRADAYIGGTSMVRTSTDWMADAACAGLGDATEDAWFPPVGNAQAKGKMAKRICGQCPVRRECLAYALHHGLEHGIWGGLTPNERKELRRQSQEPDSCTA